MKIKNIGFLIIAFAFFVALPIISDTAFAAWWDGNYTNCMNLTITNPTANARTGFPVKYNITGLTKLANDNDVRIVNAGCGLGGSEIARDILSNGSTTDYVLFLADVGASTNTNYSVYYNYPAASAPSYATDLGSTALTVYNSRINLAFVNATGVYDGSISPAKSVLTGRDQANRTIQASVRLLSTHNSGATGVSTKTTLFNGNVGSQFSVKLTSTVDATWFNCTSAWIYSNNSVIECLAGDWKQIGTANSGLYNCGTPAGVASTTTTTCAANQTTTVGGYYYGYCTNATITTEGYLMLWKNSTWVGGSYLINSAGRAFSSIDKPTTATMSSTNPFYELIIQNGDTPSAEANKWANPITTAQGTQEFPASNTTITIHSPANTTYWTANNIELKFKVVDSLLATFTVDAYLDGVSVYSSAVYANGTNVSVYTNISLANQYNFTVFAVGSVSTSTSLYFTVADFSILNVAYSNPIEEIKKYDWNITYRINPDLISNISSSIIFTCPNCSSSLIYPSAFGESDADSATNSTAIAISKHFYVPFINYNNSNSSFYFNGSIGYANGSTIYNDSASYGQNITNSIWLNANSQVQSASSLIETQPFDNYFWINHSTSFTIWPNYTAISDYRNTTYALTNSTTYFNATIDSGNITDITKLNESYNISSNVTINFGTHSKTLYSENDTITIYKIAITDCSAGSGSTVPALNLTLRQENDSALVNGTIEITNTLTNFYGVQHNYSFTASNINSTVLCIYPAWATYVDDAMIQYSAPTYSGRTYFIYANISNATSYVDLFLLPITESSSVIFFVRNEINNPVPNIIIKIQRYFVGQNIYKTVAQCKTDNPNGKCATYMKTLDVYYREILEQNMVVIKETSPAQVVCQPFEAYTYCPPYPIPISLTITDVPHYFETMGNIQTGCVLNATTNILRCTVTDTTQTMSSVNFQVDKKGPLQWINLCNQTDFLTATTFTCNLGNRTGNLYQVGIYGYFSTPPRTLWYDLLDYSSGIMLWGNMGLFLGFLIIATLFFAGIYNPAAAVLGAFIGLVAGYLLNMIPITIGSLIGIAAIVAMMLWKMR